MFAASPWTEVTVDGALSDSQITDFGRALLIANTNAMPPLDWSLCVTTLEYGAAASVAVEVFLATAAGVAVELRKQIVNETEQYFVWPSFEVPREAGGLPYTMRITKAATNARIGFRFQWVKPGGC